MGTQVIKIHIKINEPWIIILRANRKQRTTNLQAARPVTSIKLSGHTDSNSQATKIKGNLLRN